MWSQASPCFVIFNTGFVPVTSLTKLAAPGLFLKTGTLGTPLVGRIHASKTEDAVQFLVVELRSYMLWQGQKKQTSWDFS